jgi:hypothetical protein
VLSKTPSRNFSLASNIASSFNKQNFASPRRKTKVFEINNILFNIFPGKHRKTSKEENTVEFKRSKR